MKYPDLNALLKAQPEAAAYFRSLPDYVRQHMESRAGGINSFESLKDYAENLTRGDG